MVTHGKPFQAGASPWASDWLRQLVGDEPFQEVAWVILDGSSASKHESSDATTGAITSLDHLDRLQVTQTPLTAEQLTRTLKASEPAELCLIDTQVTSHTIGTLPALRAVEDLTIQFTPPVVGASCLTDLASRDRLKQLKLLNVELPDADFIAGLRAFPALEELILERSPDSTACLVHVAPLQALKLLGLQRTRLTDASLEVLRPLSRLETFQIDGSALTDRGAARLADQFPLLTNLSLHGDPGVLADPKFGLKELTDVGLANLCRRTRLEALVFPGRRITDVGLATVPQLSKLDILGLTGVEVPHAGIQNLAAARQWKFLTLAGPTVADSWFAARIN